MSHRFWAQVDRIAGWGDYPIVRDNRPALTGPLSMLNLLETSSAALLVGAIALSPLPALAAPAAPPAAATIEVQVVPPAPAPAPVPPGTTVIVNATSTPAPAPVPTPAPAPVVIQAAAPPPAPPPPAPRPKVRTGRGLLAAGLSIAGTTYVVSSLTGALAADLGSPMWGRSMMIPLAGPFIATGFTETYTGAWFTAGLGVAQAAGVLMTIVGATRYRRYRKSQVSFAAAPTRGGGHAALTVRF